MTATSADRVDGNLFDFGYWHNVGPARATALTRANAADGYPNSLTPLSQDLVITYENLGAVDFLIRGLKGQQPDPDADPYLYALWGFVYLNADQMATFGDALPGSSRQAVYEQYLGLSPDPGYSPPPVPLTRRIGAGAGAIPVLKRMLSIARGIPDRIDRLRSAAIGARREGSEITEAECLAWLMELESLMAECWSLLMAGAGIASGNFDTVAKVIGRVAKGAQPDLVNRLHVGLGGNESAASAQVVRRLAEIVRAKPELQQALGSGVRWQEMLRLDPAFAQAATAAVSRFAYRAAPELELLELSWREDPDQLLDVVRRETSRVATVDHTVEIRTEAEAELRRGVPAPLRPVVAALLKRSRDQMAYRENAKTPIVLIFDEVRRVLSAAGPSLVARGVLTQARDAVFLTFAELQGVLAGGTGPGLQELARRKELHERLRAMSVPELVMAGPDWMTPLPDSEITKRGMLVPTTSQDTTAALTGVAASPGRVTGVARVMLDPDDDFDAGDILFAKTVDPGWSAILSCAGAIVLDMGGALSHGAVVARELGIPCVVNVKNATLVVPDGATVTVDGSHGVVAVTAAG